MNNSFKDYMFLTEKKDPNLCYMVFPESPFKEQLLALQQTLQLEAEEVIHINKFHCTIRYCKLTGEKSPKPFIEWLSQQQLPLIECYTDKFTMFDDQSLVMELDSPQMREWEAKVNAWLVDSGYPPSEFPQYRPHISLAYGCSSPMPSFDIRKHRLSIKFSIHRVTNQNKETLYEHMVQPYKGLVYGVRSKS